MYPPSLIQDIKDRLSIVQVIGETVPLKKAGRNHKGLCPFHAEKTPSFHVQEEKQIFHCFGCGEGGDLLHYIMKREGLAFPEAVRQLAGRAGVELPELGDERAAAQAKQIARQRRLLLRVNELAAEFFHQQLMDETRGKAAYNYLESRGYADRAFFTQHFLGYADDDWGRLSEFLQQRRVPMELAVQLGLIKQRSPGEGHYDFFRGRLMFPIRDARGQVIAFGGRVIPNAGQPADAAKYLNSPESLLYHKSETLYGLPMAAEAMRRQDRAIVVEGNMDVLALHRAGITETVAPLGTALTAGHVRALMRYTHNIWIVFDGDAAGRRAAARSLPLFLDAVLVPRVVVLPAGDDPDSFVQQHGGDAFTVRLSAAPTLFEWVIDETLAACGDDTAGRVRAMGALRPLFARLRDAIQEASYIDRLAKRLRLDAYAIRRALADVRGDRGMAVMATVATPQTHAAADARGRAEAACLEFLIHVPGGMAQLGTRIDPAMFRTPHWQKIATACWERYALDGTVQVSPLLQGDFDDATRRALTELALSNDKYDTVDDVAREADIVVAALERALHVEEQEQLNAAIAEAVARGEQTNVETLLTRKIELERSHHVGERA